MMTEFEGPTPHERFQPEALAVYSEGDREFERDLIESYKTSIAEHLPKLEEALIKEDEKESILHSHDIKGSSSYIGAEAVRFLSGKIESFCKNKNMKEAAKYLAELQNEVKEAVILLDSYMESWNEGAPAADDSSDKNSKDSKDSKDQDQDKDKTDKDNKDKAKEKEKGTDS